MAILLAFSVMIFASVIAIWVNDTLPVGDYIADEVA